MVAPGFVPTVTTESTAESRPASPVKPRPARFAGSVSAVRSYQLWYQTGEVRERQGLGEIPNVVSSAVTGAQIPASSQESVSTESLAGNIFRAWHDVREQVHKTTIAALPRPSRLAVNFEPHLRQSTVRNLRSLFAQFRQSIGEPMAAVIKSELIASLRDGYKKSALSDETRHLAFAISLLQDSLRPHCSQISADKIEAIGDRINLLASQQELPPAVL